ncbi:hypothetical protein T06_16600 [Trichinella sp. T6]|nr:hypothetical protein T06_16600 [Trichinella sp. T6]
MNLKQLTDTQRAHCELRTVMYNTLEFEINQTARRNMVLRYETLLATSITELVLLDSFELKHSFLPSAHLEASPSEYSIGYLTLKKCQKIEKMLITSSYQ